MRIGADALAERIRRARTRRLQSRKPAAANNHDPARLVVGKASAPFDTDPVGFISAYSSMVAEFGKC